MRFTTVFVMATAASALATGKRDDCDDCGEYICLNDDQVDIFVNLYEGLVSDIKSVSQDDIEKYVSPDFQDWSNSINAFLGKPYDQPAFESRDAFVAAQTALAQQVPITVDSIMGYNCDTISILWHADFPLTGKPARGITVIETDDCDGQTKIIRVDVEFNSLAWAAGVGGGYKVFDQCVGNIVC